MEYANKIKSPAVLLYGEDEIKSGKPTLRNLRSGKEQSIEVRELVNEIKKLSETIIKNFKRNGFVLSERMFFTSYILRDQGKNLEVRCLHLIEDGKTMCLRPDLTVASCISFLQKNLLQKSIIMVKNIEDLVIKEQILSITS